MAKINTCDGTGVEIPEDAPTTGHYGKQYCEAARIEAEAYLAEVDTLHTLSATAFQTGLDALRQKYRGKLTTLPDES